jgi:hypothetical protein
MSTSNSGFPSIGSHYFLDFPLVYVTFKSYGVTILSKTS